MSRTGSNGFTGIGRWFAVVFAILLSGIALAPVQASADDCVALGGTLGAECVISGAVAGARTGTFTLNETLRFTSGGKLTTAPPTGIVINITAGDFIMQNNTTIDGSSATFGAPIKVQLTSGNIDLQTGSQVLSNGLVGGFIQLISGPTATVDIDGLVQSKGTITGTGANQAPGGGPISIIAGCDLTVSDTGQILSEGADPGADLIHLQGCTVQVFGLVASRGAGHATPNAPPNSCNSVTPAAGTVRRNPVTRPGKDPNSTGCVEIWSGTTLVIDSTGTHKGEVSADIGTSGGTKGIGWIDLFANGNININDGNGNGANVFAVHANGGLFQTSDTGGLITVITTHGSVIATGNAIQADATSAGSAGGQIFVQANQNISFSGGNIFARGDANGTGGFGVGGIVGSATVPVRAFNGSLSWTSGIGDVLPTGTGVPAANRGQINLQGCTGVNIVGATFPAIPPGTFTPNVLAASCNPAGPTLPAYATPFPLANCLTQCGLPPATGKQGTKFNDMLGDGVIGPGDTPLPNWTFRVYDNTGTLVATALTDGNGLYTFTLMPGTYTVCEVLQAGWTQTFPHAGTPGAVSTCQTLNADQAVWGYQFTLVDHVETGNDFANHFTAPVCPQDPLATCSWFVDPGTPGTHLCTPANPHCNSLGAAYGQAANGQTICLFTPTIENAVLDLDKTLTITECRNAKITAADSSKPVVTIDGAGVLTIIGPDAIGGTVGWLVKSNNNELRGVGASGASVCGIQVDGNTNRVSWNTVSGNAAGICVNGDTNDLRGGTVESNTGAGIRLSATAEKNVLRGSTVQKNGGSGIVVEGTGNTVRDSSRVEFNSGDGLTISGCSNALDSNVANNNGAVGFNITKTCALGSGNTLKNNKSNTSNQGGAKENGGPEYCFGPAGNNTTVDLGGNKKDNVAFIGSIPPPPTRRFFNGCYE